MTELLNEAQGTNVEETGAQDTDTNDVEQQEQQEHVEADAEGKDEDADATDEQAEGEDAEEDVGAPDEYKFDFSEDEDLKDVSVDTENPLFQDMMPAFKEAGLTQEQANTLMKSYLKNQKGAIPDPEAEREALGANADNIIKDVTAFANKHLSAEEAQVLRSMGAYAEELQVLHKLVKMTKAPSGKIPTDSSTDKVSAADLREQASKMRKESDFNTNLAKQKKYDALWKQIAKLEEE